MIYTVGRCPASGHPLYFDSSRPAQEPYGCLCPGRYDGLYAEPFGYHVHPKTHEVKEHGQGKAWEREKKEVSE